MVEFLAEGTDYLAVRGLVDDLYAESPFHASRFLSAIRWELPSELEETALRWRTSRLADLGHPTREEALSWFTRPPATPAPPAGLPDRPPGFWLARLGSGSLLARAAAALTGEEREHLELELVAAANAVMVADGIDPGEPEAVRAAVELARAQVELGLAELAGSDLARAAEVLATTAVKTLFQHGFGRALDLAARARRLFAGGGAGRREAPFLDAPLGEALSALARRRPLYFPGLEAPRARWGSPEAGAFTARPFLGAADLERTAEALRLSEELAALALQLGLAARTEGPAAPRLSALYLTALANERLGRAFRPDPLAAEELSAAVELLADLIAPEPAPAAPGDPGLAGEGEAGALLTSIARAAAEELAPLREGRAPAGLLPGALLVAPASAKGEDGVR